MEHGIQHGVRDEFVMAASPVTRLLGHSLAVALGFCGLAAISMIPIGAMKVLRVLCTECGSFPMPIK